MPSKFLGSRSMAWKNEFTNHEMIRFLEAYVKFMVGCGALGGAYFLGSSAGLNAAQRSYLVQHGILQGMTIGMYTPYWAATDLVRLGTELTGTRR
jgi:hypothetical protein